MALLSDVPGRARFSLTYQDVLDLPLGLAESMMEQLSKWRAQEDVK